MEPTYLNRHGLSVAAQLVSFIEAQVLPGINVEADAFWSGMASAFERLAPENARLLRVRDEMQSKIDSWHNNRRGQPIDYSEYEAFLRDIGYLVPEPKPFSIQTERVDREVAELAGPQLVVPISNERFLLNAANARWGSLYDALYGTDAIAGAPQGGSYGRERGVQVIGWAKQFLDLVVPLAEGSWEKWEGGQPMLADPDQYVGSAGDSILLQHHGLHLELVIDRSNPIGASDPAGLADVVMESALTTIADLEDSVAAVDSEDKVAGYSNWLGLLKGELEATFEKGGKTIKRRLADDRRYICPDGKEFVLPGRCVIFVRNVGHLMTTNAVLLPDGAEAPEGILDGIVTSLISLHDLQGDGPVRNSRSGSIYIVKPKMHGPEEVEFANCQFDAIEDLLGLQRNTIKLGLMDEERRTSANLAACIHAAKDRIVFINTGFLDRTGDEIHTSMHAGPMMRKSDLKRSEWIAAYEDRNVQIGLACGFSGKAQIGKGMWTAPDRMADMLNEKISHPLEGANTAWVPSPTAATLHATHYHQVNVGARQEERMSEPIAPLSKLLTIPFAQVSSWLPEEIAAELENNSQGILGYVVRWIDKGIGCSKVPDIHDIGLMEDRATLRISSQLLANWLEHNVVSKLDVETVFKKMARKVDRQNANDRHYRSMADRKDSFAFAAARALVFEGAEQPNGYTEPLLHRFRRAAKRAEH